MADLASDTVEVTAEGRDDLKLVARFADGAPQLSGGVGGWEAVARPGRRPLTPFRGVGEPLTLTLPLLLDGFDQAAEGRSVEDDVLTIFRMGGNEEGDPEPPVLKVRNALPNTSDIRWVLTAAEWGDMIRRRDRHRVRQAVTLTLIRFTEDDRLESVASGKTKPSYKVVKATSKLNTYSKLAAKHCGSAKYGTRLARLNGERSASKKLKVNTKVRLPTKEALTDWQRGR
jgi:hypothetical protein